MLFWKRDEAQQATKRAVITTVFFMILGFALLLITPVAAFNYVYADKVFPGVSVNGIKVGGMTAHELSNLIESKINHLNEQGFVFSAAGKSITLTPSTIALNDPDLTYDIVTFNTNALVENAYGHGRTGSLMTRVLDQAQGLFGEVNVPVIAQVNKGQLRKALEENFSELENEGHNSNIEFNGAEIIFTPEKPGSNLDYDYAITVFENSLNLEENQPISIPLREFVPQISQAIASTHQALVMDVVKDGKAVVITYDRYEWKLPVEKYREMLEFYMNEEGFVSLRFNKDELLLFVETIAKEVYQEPKDAVLKFNDEKTVVTEFVPQQPGQSMNKEVTMQDISDAVFVRKDYKAKATVSTDEAAVGVGDLNELGIKDLLATGTSDYSGSPTNRRHNIAVGARAFNGVLLAPGEEFSALKYVGEVDEKSGYKPELVIKGNKTEPEYGGGLCQVSSTMFRAALRAGLDITARRNHSYTVRYYSPIGTDATIYSPAPDFKFLNDTQHHILIHTINDAKNSKLYFEIWGTDDGRTTELTEPVTYDWVQAPPTKIIETLDLKPGEKKCTEVAHSGVKAYFDRIITLADGTKNEERFHSNYRPWQAVCLVGVEKLSTETPATPEGEGTTPTDPTTPTPPLA
ncbi:VanW family protein, partial [Candidatus Falkowbacteria bacterium]|nr:VanW family protein [Candidatus Falkowbacteria bacterium]